MKKERGVSLVSVIMIIILLAILVVLVWLGIMMMNKNDEGENIAKVDNDESNVQNINDGDNDKENDEEEYAEKELNINSELVQNLYSKVLKINRICFENENDDGSQYSFYKNKKVTTGNLSNEEKVITVLQYLKEYNKGEKVIFNSIDSNIREKMQWYSEMEGVDMRWRDCTIYSKDMLNTAKNQIFGNDVNIDWVTIETGVGETREYIDGSYYYYSYPGGGGPYEWTCASKIEKATEDEKYVYIYDKFMYSLREEYVDSDFTSHTRVNLYTNASLNNKISTGDYTYLADGLEDIREETFNRFINQLDTFKHTFKKDSSGNYYWVSTEKV